MSIKVFPTIFSAGHDRRNWALTSFKKVLKRNVFFFCLISISFCISNKSAFSQSHTSRNDYTGDWEDPLSWNPVWPIPVKTISGYDITINGYITVNGNLTFSALPTNLIINDTLVIQGDLFLGNNNDLTINDNGILIVRGSLEISNQTIINANGYLIISDDLIKNSTVNQGSITSNDDPVKIYIGGSISSVGITNNNVFYPAINCSSPGTIPYPNTNCSYGNLLDLANDPIYPFYQPTCVITTPNITADGPTTFCSGNSVTLTSSPESGYLWSTGATTQSISVDASGSYTVITTNSSGCQSTESDAMVVTVNDLPVTPTITADGPTTFCSGNSVTLTSSPESGYLWSTGATTQSISVDASGTYTVITTNSSGCQSTESDAMVVTVNDLPVTPTITADGPTSFCSGNSVTLTSSPESGYLWSTGATTQSISVDASGSIYCYHYQLVRMPEY